MEGRKFNLPKKVTSYSWEQKSLLTGLFALNEKETFGWPLNVEWQFIVRRRAAVGKTKITIL